VLLLCINTSVCVGAIGRVRNAFFESLATGHLQIMDFTCNQSIQELKIFLQVRVFLRILSLDLYSFLS
jgi:hypothetical protein